MFRQRTLAALVLLGLASTPVLADTDAIQQRFERADLNGDGVLNKHEARTIQGLAPYFRHLDNDGSGDLSPDEFTRAVALRDRFE